MKVIKIASLSLLALAGNSVDAAFYFPQFNSMCNDVLDDLQVCLRYNDSNDSLGLTKAVGKADECLKAAADFAAKTACLNPLFDIAEKGFCDPQRIDFGKWICGFKDISANLEDAAALLEDKEEDKFIAVDAALPEVSEFGDLAFDVFEDISADLKDELELDTKAYASKLRGRQ